MRHDVSFSSRGGHQRHTISILTSRFAKDPVTHDMGQAITPYAHPIRPAPVPGSERPVYDRLPYVPALAFWICFAVFAFHTSTDLFVINLNVSHLQRF